MPQNQYRRFARYPRDLAGLKFVGNEVTEQHDFLSGEALHDLAQRRKVHRTFTPVFLTSAHRCTSFKSIEWPSASPQAPIAVDGSTCRHPDPTPLVRSSHPAA